MQPRGREAPQTMSAGRPASRNGDGAEGPLLWTVTKPTPRHALSDRKPHAWDTRCERFSASITAVAATGAPDATRAGLSVPAL